MFVFNGFTEQANQALNKAISIAASLGHTCVGSEHIIYGLCAEEASAAAAMLEKNGVTAAAIEEKLRETFGVGLSCELTPAELTPRSRRILQNAMLEARKLAQRQVGTEHILLSLLQETESYAMYFLQELASNPKELYPSCMREISCKSSGGDTGRPAEPAASGREKTLRSTAGNALAEYGRDLTEQAFRRTLDPVFGRDKEINRIIQILSRRTKNNPCLIGEPGVGKTAVIEGLAEKIAAGEVPEIIKNKRIVSLDLTAMLAGAKYRGDFEDRIRRVLEQVRSLGNVILFIDELHNIIGAGAAEGAIDAANILKPRLARGELQLIGATTIAEYRKHIEKDAALERRFQPVMVEEPGAETSIAILKGIRCKYEIHHKIRITDEALEAAVALSSRYIPDRRLPDKAIDLMDEAASRVRLKTFTSPPNVKSIEEKLKRLSDKKTAAVNAQDFERAAALRDEEKTLQLQYNDQLQGWQQKQGRPSCAVTAQDIAEVVAGWTSIPVQQLTESESDRLLHLEDVLHQRIIGQEQAIHAVASAIRRSRLGLRDPERPVGSFLFLGPTGVGKTEVCRALAEVLFGSENGLIRLDMSEYMERHAVSRMIGAPPGYIGYDEGGQLTEQVRRRPYSVVLFDEIEKAHPDVFHLLLQILEDGTLTDSQGRKTDFRNTVIILTSNLGAQHLTGTGGMGFADAGLDEDRRKSAVLSELKHQFQPELLNRLDEIVVFSRLSHDELATIGKQMLHSLAERAEPLGIFLSFSDEAVNWIAKNGWDPQYGARPLRRTISSRVEDALAKQLLTPAGRGSGKFRLVVREGELAFES